MKVTKRIRKKVVVIGRGPLDGMVSKRALIENLAIDQIDKLVEHTDTDEIVICEQLQNEKILHLLVYFIQKLKIDVLFTPSIYLKMLREKINGGNSVGSLSTFVGRKRDVEEFLIRSLDMAGSLLILFVSLPIMILISFLIRISSPGPILYKQKRVGKDGAVFTLYKFRTMVKDAERTVGPVLASHDDPRVTRLGRILRKTRLDELPQLFNVLRGHMSLVGPRPERPHFVKLHKALRELRLVVKPGITGLAQIRSFYDLKPKHKIRYDYLYIQQRSFLLNLYILAKTVPVLFSKKGW
ncbi:MAG: sugar transferase [Planctomycetota bacterium]